MDPALVFLILAILIVAIFVFVAITISSRKPHVFDVEEYQIAWLKIENSLTKSNRASYSTSVINADKLLDKAMAEMGVPGNTMGERLKRIAHTGKLSDIQSVWYAHKLRNRIAHEADFSINYGQARQSMTIFKQALKDLGAI
ncbi:hypothetical protein IJH74_00650 [Candidatus Saccharibacteria bacterium]|nr:hypothetical protein [Candidatus Saccharibacteria bacterium]